MNLNYPSVDEYNAQYEMDLAWDALVAGDVTEALAALVRMVGQSDLPGRAPDSFFSSERVKVARYFLTYDYPELQRTTENVKRSFALVAAWKSLLSQFQIQYQPRKEAWDKAEPVATILGTGYILDIDVEAICEAIYGEDGKYVAQHQSLHPVPSYAQRAELLPDLPSLLPLSLTARTAFVRAAQFANQSGLAERQRIGPLNASELELGLNELTRAGLIDLDPGTTDLLMNLTLKDLRQFAFEHDIKSHGPKYRLIRAIVAQAGQEEIKKLLRLLGDKRYVRPLVADLPLLQKHVGAESSRVGWYLKWIEHVLCLSHTPPKLQTVQWPPPDRDMKPWVRISENPTAYLREPWNHTEVELVRTIWDSKCDEIVRNLADKYAWDAPWYISDAIVAYLPSEKLDSFKRACEESKTHVWYNVLMYYGEARLAEMGVETRQPRSLECAGCGRQFLEWSIHMGLAQRVGYKVLFCITCYAKSLDIGEKSL